MEKMSNLFPKYSPYKCVIDNCDFQTNKKVDLQEHYIRRHDILESFMKEALAIKNLPS